MKSNCFLTRQVGENSIMKPNDAEGSEEGEIVDSDEEQNMRRRIKELEAKNDELEKIASISGDFTNQYRYSTDCHLMNPKRIVHMKVSKQQSLMSQKDVARIPSDASSISSDEMEPVRKRSKRKDRHSKRDHCKKYRSRSNSLHKLHSHHHNRHHKSENKVINNVSEDYCRKFSKYQLRSQIVINENYLETISLDSDEDFDAQDKQRNIIDSNSDDSEMKNSRIHLNRDKLRFAIARDRTKESRTSINLLRERLYNGNALLDHRDNVHRQCVDDDIRTTDSLVATKTAKMIQSENKSFSHTSEQSAEKSDQEEWPTQEEQELRLIALKSAILKKHLARKKRNAEMAYSPTDFSPVIANAVNTDDHNNMDVVIENEFDDLSGVMEISPANSPKLILSPARDEENVEKNVFVQNELKKRNGDNNSVDMDIAQSDSEEEFYNFKNDIDRWCPIETAPITTQSVEAVDALKYPLSVPFGIYVPEMQYQLQPQLTLDPINSHSNIMISERKRIPSPPQPPPPLSANIFGNLVFDEEPPPPPSMCFVISDDDDDNDNDDDEPSSTANNTFSNIFSEMKFDEEPPPPPPFFCDNENRNTNTNANANESIENTNLDKLEDKTEAHTDDFPFNEVESSSSNPNPNSNPQSDDDCNENKNENDKDSDEEVSALRAVLLSKLQTAKSLKKENHSQKESGQSPTNIESMCHTTEEKPEDNNGVETVLQKALRRLKSNFTPSFKANSKENDEKTMSQEEECLDDELTRNGSDTTDDEHREWVCVKKNLPDMEKKTATIDNSVKKRINKIGSTQLPSIQITVPEPPLTSNCISENSEAELNNSPAKEMNAINQIDTHSKEDVGSCRETPPIATVHVLTEKNQSEMNCFTLNREIPQDRIIDSSIEIKESREDSTPHKHTGRQAKLVSTLKNSTTNENNTAITESSLKRKVISLSTSLPVVSTVRPQPLSVKNNSIPSHTSSLKSAQNLIQSNLNRVRTTRTTKIVRPNKVINKEITTNFKRALTSNDSSTPLPKIPRITPNQQQQQKQQQQQQSLSTKTTSSTYTIGDVVPKITVKKLIINLRASDTETSDDDLLQEIPVPVDNSVERVKRLYNEIASPLELLMNSASSSPARNKNSIVKEQPVANQTVGPAFEKKLDAFLQEIRERGSLENSAENQTPISSPNKKKDDSGKNINTPTAVRHLPLASQDEYRRLVHRMKLLEKQKQAKLSDEDASTQKLSTKNNIPAVKNGKIQPKVVQTTKAVGAIVGASNTKKSIQLQTLHSYETSFNQTSENIVKLLNKSLSLVAEAKKTKIAKLRHEKRLQELRMEMSRVQAQFELEDRKFCNMRPHIGESNQFLTSLKKKRRILMENANNLGKTIKGDEYRLSNKTGEEIIEKSRKLHAEIKFVNSLKTENVETTGLLQSKTTESLTGVSHTTNAIQQLETTVNRNDMMKLKQCFATESSSTKSMSIIEEEEEEEEKVEKMDDSGCCGGGDDGGVPTSETQSLCDKNGKLEKMELHARRENDHDVVRVQKTTGSITATTTTTVDENPTPVRADIVEENKERVELEAQHADHAASGNIHDDGPADSIHNADDDDSSSSKRVVPEYISPLDHFRHEYRSIDFNGIVCPYEMWGKCADESCSYMHITKEKKRGTELAFKPTMPSSTPCGKLLNGSVAAENPNDGVV